jgi:hypothetical protein
MWARAHMKIYFTSLSFFTKNNPIIVVKKISTSILERLNASPLLAVTAGSTDDPIGAISPPAYIIEVSVVIVANSLNIVFLMMFLFR